MCVLVGLGSNDLHNQGKQLLQLNRGFGELEHQLVLRNCYTSTFGTPFLETRSFSNTQTLAPVYTDGQHLAPNWVTI